MKNSRCIISKWLFFLCLFSILSIYTNDVFGQAMLRVVPNTGFYTVDENFDINLIIDTDDQNVVSTAAYIRYDTAHFRVNSVDTSESVFLMESEMLIDSDIGEIKITRGSTSPGVNTSNGKIARINLTALYPIIPEDYNFTFKESQISPYESCVIADYPLGTNILSMVSNGRFVVSSSSLYGDFEGDCDVDGMDIAITIDKEFSLDIESFAQKFGISDCP